VGSADIAQLHHFRVIAERVRVTETIARADRPVPQAKQGNGEKDDTAMDAAMTDTTTLSGLPGSAAKMMAVEVLLAEPESLGDDVLEACLYILREKLRTA
jgi:hypothetical protein